jgi:hypothetical protein
LFMAQGTRSVRSLKLLHSQKHELRSWCHGVAHILDGGVGQTSRHADHTARQHATQAVGGEARAKHGLDLVLQDHARLVTAQVGHGCARTQG